MTRVVFMCGPAGSGKSTYARTLENEGWIRLSFDEEAWRRGIRAQPLSDDIQQEIERDLRARLIELVRGGTEVVLDFSFWSRAMRDEYRGLLRPWGIVPETMYLNTPRPVALERVRGRTGAHAGDVSLPEGVAAKYFDHFEPPTVEEGPLTVIG
ncbi:putative kinase [Nakamurella sp. UYEF19]|uniref:AAA family ATPase n=1 Tax=Nakamurella sp. UYEF19 TaxID=1756392 RepID=UPI003395FF3D